MFRHLSSMKRIIALLLLLPGFLSAQKIKGIHLLNYSTNSDLLELSNKIEGLSELGINTIFLEVDYHFDFQSHPELRQTEDVITRSVAQKFAKICNSYGIEIVPQFQSLGHQSWAENTWKLLTVYPELDLTPGAFPNNDSIYCREWDVMNPKVNEIVFPLIDEIIDAFNAKGVHLGMDEVFLLGHPKSPSTKGMDPAFLFGKTVRAFHEYFSKEKGKQLYIWGDRLIDGTRYNYGAWEASLNGTAKAIDSIPTDIIICDWHYNPQQEYKSVDLFINKGFRVLPSSWKDANAANDLIKYSYAKQDSLMIGHMFTTWGAVQKPLLLDYESMLSGLQTIEKEQFHEVYIQSAGLNEKGEMLVALKTSNSNIKVAYTLGGSVPKPDSVNYSVPFVYTGGVIKALPVKNGVAVGDLSESEFTIHKALGKKVTFLTEPSDKYAAANQDQLLVNGVELYGGFGDGQWLGFEGNDAELLIDLGRSTKINSISINFNNKVNSWIHHPSEVVVLGSADGKTFDVLKKATKRKTGKPLVNYTLQVESTVRYVKIIAKNQIIPAGFTGEGNPAWLFIDEIVVK